MAEHDSTRPVDLSQTGEAYLLTPGPLTTSPLIKQAMLRDWGSWDEDFRGMTRQLRQQLLAMLEDTKNEFECVPMQGSGHLRRGIHAGFVATRRQQVTGVVQWCLWSAYSQNVELHGA